MQESKEKFSPLEDIRFATDELQMLLMDFRRVVTEIDSILLGIDRELKKHGPRSLGEMFGL